MKLEFAVILIFQFGFLATGEHLCNTRIPNIKELVNGIKIEELPPHHRERRAASSNLRIHFDYQSSFTNAPNSNTFINNIMEPTRDRLQKLLIPNAPTQGILRVDRNCISNTYKIINGIKACQHGCTTTTCLGAQIPDIYLKRCVEINSNGTVINSGAEGSGIANIDIVLLVTYLPCNDGALAYAASCFMESTLDRPVLGVINLCSSVIVLSNNFKYYIKLVTHEIIHALGFSVDKYAFYRNSDGTPMVPRNRFGWPITKLNEDQSYYLWNDKIIKQFTRKRASVSTSYTVQFNGFVLPNVLAAARNHFNCPSLESVDIEDYGGSNSALSHFDEYFLYNELMTPQSNEELDVLSNMTLSLLKDTGWYNVDYSSIEILDYGYKKGCVLPEQGCYTYMQSQKSNLDPFCNKIFAYGKILDCSRFKNYYYICGLNEFQYVDPKFQYFRSLEGVNNANALRYTGLSPFNEYCPTYKSMNNPSFVCNNELNNNLYNGYNIVPSYYGTDSMCFRNELTKFYSSIFYGASCQRYKMIKYPNNLTIFVGQKSFDCPSEKIHSYYLIDGKEVIIRCPDDVRTLNGQRSSMDMWKLFIILLFMVILHSDYSII